MLMTGKKNEEETANLLQVSTQVTTNAEQSLSEIMQQFATFVAKALTHLTHGKQTTSFPVTQNHH
jgi:hypothetical protein